MPRPAVPHHLDSLNVQSIVHMMFMAFLIMISVCCTFLWSFLKVYCEQNYSCHNFTYLSAGAPLTAQPFLLSWSILLSFPCLKFVIIFPVGKCFINMYSHTHTHTHTHTQNWGLSTWICFIQSRTDIPNCIYLIHECFLSLTSKSLNIRF